MLWGTKLSTHSTSLEGRKASVPEHRQFGMNKPPPQTPLQILLSPFITLHSSFFTTKTSNSYKAVSVHTRRNQSTLSVNNWPPEDDHSQYWPQLPTASLLPGSCTTPFSEFLSPPCTCGGEIETTGGSVLRPHLSDISSSCWLKLQSWTW